MRACKDWVPINYIDLYWVHAWDFTTPVDEVMRVLDDMVRAGKVLYVGIPDTPAWIVSQANTLADQRGWSPFVGPQIEYSADRAHAGAGAAADGQGARYRGGRMVAARRWHVERQVQAQYRTVQGNPTCPNSLVGRLYPDRQELTIAEEMEAVAAEIERPPAQVAINWIRQQKGKGVVIPIIDARKLSQLKDNLAVLD